LKSITLAALLGGRTAVAAAWWFLALMLFGEAGVITLKLANHLGAGNYSPRGWQKPV
jgi:hypothetical protein